jgi:hypothetical protein
MNERIRLLALQAGATTTQRSGWIDYGTLDLDVEKFAELIVRECITRLEQHHPFTKDPEAYLYAISLIEEHFGVEECDHKYDQNGECLKCDKLL